MFVNLAARSETLVIKRHHIMVGKEKPYSKKLCLCVCLEPLSKQDVILSSIIHLKHFASGFFFYTILYIREE